MTEPIPYGFREQMAMSQGVAVNNSIRDILLNGIPGAVSVSKAEEKDDRNGTDWWVTHVSENNISVDLKAREEDWASKPEPLRADDLALETFSVIEKRIVGWTRRADKRTDYVLWFWKDSLRWCLIPFPMLCGVFSDHWEQWRKEYKTRRQMTTSAYGSDYHSECTFVPRLVVWRAIYLRYGGSITAESTVKNTDKPLDKMRAEEKF